MLTDSGNNGKQDVYKRQDQVEHVFVNMENKAVEMFRRGELDIMNVRKPEAVSYTHLRRAVRKRAVCWTAPRICP